MTVKSERVYWIECDHAYNIRGFHCLETSVQFPTTHTAAEASKNAERRGWTQADLGYWLCPFHGPTGGAP